MRYLTLTKHLKSPALAALAAFAFFSSATAQIRYELVVPEVSGTPINRVSTQSNEINENGETLLNRVSTFAVWKDKAITNIVSGLSDYPASFSSINASSINRFGQVVGTKTYRVKDENGTHTDSFPFYWDNHNGLVDLDDLGGRSADGAGTTTLYKLNDEGLAIGTTQVFDGNEKAGNQAFVWSFENGRSDISPLHEIGAYSFTTPQGLNTAGTVVGTYRKFSSTVANYNEHAFIYDAERGSRDLAGIDSDFFQADHYTARDINESNMLVGERDRHAYLYDLDAMSGYEISSSDDSNRATKAYALNNNDVVAGTTENRDNSGHSPIIWTRSTGTIELLPQIKRDLENILPEGITADSCKITPKSINTRGQISASLETATTFSREIVLTPVLDFHWHSQVVTEENGVRGVRYTHSKAKQEATGTIPVAALGYEIAFECSSDMQNWSPIPADSQETLLKETNDAIELFVPFSQCIFIRPALKTISSEGTANEPI